MHITIDISKEATKRLLVLGSVFSVGLVAAAVYAALPFPNLTDGQVLTAAQLNGNFGDLNTRLSALETSVAAGSVKSAFRAHKSDALSLANNVDTPVVFNVEEFDVADEFSPVTGAFTAKAAGYYNLSCTILFKDTSVLGLYAVSLLVDGTDVLSPGLHTDGITGMTATTLVKLQVGNVATCRAYQTNTGAAAQSLRTDYAWDVVFSGSRAGG